MILWVLILMSSVISSITPSITPSITQSITSYPKFTKHETYKFISMINKERSRIPSIKPVTINWDLTRALEQFIDNGGANWGYEDTWFLPDIYNHYTKFHVLKTNNMFMNITKQYNGLYKSINESYLDAAHDTFYDSGYKNQALQIVQLRINQRICFKYYKCSNSYSNYESCTNYKVTNHTVKHPCEWFYWYYPRLIHNKLKEVAFVKLQRPGRFVVEKKQNNAWLIVFIMNNFTDYINDLPY